MKLRTNFAVFALFFASALIESVRSQNWLNAVIFIALGVLFIWADIQKK